MTSRTHNVDDGASSRHESPVHDEPNTLPPPTPEEVEKAKAGAAFYVARDAMVPAWHVAPLLTTIQTQASEIEGLRLALLGGEDAPGYAMSLPLAQVLDTHAQHQSFMRDCADRNGFRAEQLQSAVDEALEALRPFADVTASYTAGGLSADLRHGPTFVTESGHQEKLAPKHFFAVRALYDRLKGRQEHGG